MKQNNLELFGNIHVRHVTGLKTAFCGGYSTVFISLLPPNTWGEKKNL